MVIVEEHSCNFHWDIHHPFVPSQKVSATFCDCSPNASRWEVTVVPLMQKTNYWRFEFCLQFVPSLNGPDRIAVNRVQVGISLNGRRVEDKDVSNVWFGPRNYRGYRFETMAISNQSLMNPDLLAVAVTLHLPGPSARACKNIEGRNVNDPAWLSRDMLQLLLSPVYYNMRLRSEDNATIRVHSCIIRARWDNFFLLNENPADPEDAVDTNISSIELLNHILIYMYSGLLVFTMHSLPETAELFQVVQKYELFHLYKALAKDDLNQRRVTGRSVITESCIFPLEGVLSHPNDPYQQFWTLNQNTQYRFLFIVKVLNWDGPWISYSLQSRSSLLVHAQVNLEIQKQIVETRGTTHQTTCVHQCNYVILPAQHVESGGVVFLGSHDTFGDFTPANRQGQSREVQYSLRCILKFTDGKTVEHIQSRGAPLATEHVANFEILADHLLDLKRETFHADLRVIAPAEDPLNEPCCSYEIHKAIFKARVPDWSRIFEYYVPGEEDQPTDVAALIMRPEYLHFVLDYVYSSRVFTILYNFLDDIERFAETGRCSALSNFVNRIKIGDDFDLTGSP